MKPEDRRAYHIFCMGFCEAEDYNRDASGVTHRLSKIEALTDYLKAMQINTLLLSPLFESVSHGYDTTDYRSVDRRLGDNEDLRHLVRTMHEAGIDVILDCVFNHVGREHFAVQDLLKNRESARYKDWFVNVNFYGNNSYNDGLWYADWAGCQELVKLNLYNPEVKDYLKETLLSWIDEYDIDGVRLDACNVMDSGFVSELAGAARAKKPGFFLFGEIVGGDYGNFIRNNQLDSCTNYECYKGLYSSLNDRNYFEIAHSIRRLMDQGGMAQGYPLSNFADNHDVNRVATSLRDRRLLSPLYILLYTMPGYPTVYYGSEQGIEGEKRGGDKNLRPGMSQIDFNPEHPLYRLIARLGEIRAASDVLREGRYIEGFIRPQSYGFVREKDGRRVYTVLNMEEQNVSAPANLHGDFVDAITGDTLHLDGDVPVDAFSGRILFEAGDVPEELLTKKEPEISVKEESVEVPDPKESGTFMPDKKAFMDEAIREAELARTEGEVPIGAVVVKDGEIIARAHNQKEALNDPSAHAEILALRRAAEALGDWRLDGCSLFVTAEPCPMCLGAVMQTRLAELIYGCPEPKFGAHESHPGITQYEAFPAVAIYPGVREEACRALLQDFFKNVRNK